MSLGAMENKSELCITRMFSRGTKLGMPRALIKTWRSALSQGRHGQNPTAMAVLIFVLSFKFIVGLVAWKKVGGKRSILAEMFWM